MTLSHRAQLEQIRTFPQLIRFLRDEMAWPIESEDFEDLTFTYTLEELGIDSGSAAKSAEIKRLRPLVLDQPWGIFFVKFEPKRLPVVALRRILSAFVMRKRASANSSDRMTWETDDLLFISSYGEDEERQLSFAHFSPSVEGNSLPTLKVLGWDNRDTALHLDAVAETLTQLLVWPAKDADAEDWRKSWRSAFTLRNREVITTSRELSIRLAELARAIRDRINTALAIETDRGQLTKLMKAFREALVHDLTADGFADMYAQTIAYGLLSARIADPKSKTTSDLGAHMRTNPLLRDLMTTFLSVDDAHEGTSSEGLDFDELGVNEVIEVLDDANMEAVLRDFGDRNPQEDPVIHFYELFLKEYDPGEKAKRGVFYTPRPVVSCIVRSVDEVLRTDFGLEDGLADTTTWGEMANRRQGLAIPKGVSPDQAFVQILDPATGTGTFLVEIIDVIHRTLTLKWQDEGAGAEETIARWNDYVPEHLLPRLHGYELLMAPYAIAHLKAGLKLHETGYRFGSDERVRIYLTNALEQPHDLTGQFDFAIPALAHEAVAVNEVKRNQRFNVVVGNPPYSALSANLTPANRRIVDRYRQVDGVPIRERSMLQFEKNIQDDYIKFFAASQALSESVPLGVTGLVTNHSFLDGLTLRGMRRSLTETYARLWFLDLHGNANKRELEYAGDENVFDIRQGVAISLLVRDETANGTFCATGHLRGPRQSKYSTLGAATMQMAELQPFTLTAPDYLFLAFESGDKAEFEAFLSVDKLLAKNLTGTTSGFDQLLVNFDQRVLERNLREFCDKGLSDVDVATRFRITRGHARSLLARRGTVDLTRLDEYIKPFQMFPFDYRWAFLRKDLLQGHRFDVMENVASGKPGLVVMRQTKERFGAFVVSGFCGHKILGSYDRSYVFPLFDLKGLVQTTFLDGRQVARLLGGEGDPLRVFSYVYAVLYSLGYRERYAEFLRTSFPRVPTPADPALLDRLAELGSMLTGLHLMEAKELETRATTYVGPASPEVGRVSWSEETAWLDAPPTKRGKGTVGFHGVPQDVWNFHIGGYQVCEKWLKDRKGRVLSSDDIAHYQKIVVALSETMRLMQEIDVVIEEHGGWPGAFRSTASDWAG